MTWSWLILYLLPAFKVILFFVLWFVIAPRYFISGKINHLSRLEQFFLRITYGVFFTIVTVYTLSPLRLMESFSLLGVFIFCISFKGCRNRHDVNARLVGFIRRFAGNLFDALDYGFSGKAIVTAINNKIWHPIKLWFSRLSLVDLLIIVIFGIMFTYRFYPRIINLYLAQGTLADPYVHLVWAKLFQGGTLFSDGVYPMGYHTIIVALQCLSGSDFFHILRFLGPIASCVLLVGIYWLLFTITENKILAFMGTAAIGLSTINGISAYFYRQILSLPMEFAITLALPGWLFSYRYLITRDRRYLVTWAIIATSIFLIHSYSSVILLLGSGCIVLSLLLSRNISYKRIFDFIVVGLIALFVGNLPMVIGRLLGMPWHTSTINYVQSKLSTQATNSIMTLEPIIKAWGDSQTIFVLVMVGILLLMSIWTLFKRGTFRNPWPTFALLLLVITLLLNFSPAYFGLSLVDPDRLVFMVALVRIIGTVVIVNQIWQPISHFFKQPGKLLNYYKQRIIIPLLLITYSVGWLILYPPLFQIPNDKIIEYNIAAEMYFKIKRDFPINNWTIVAPVEQYEEALGYGWHYELWEFVKDYPIESATQRNLKLKIPTPYVFIFVEKVPLKIYDAEYIKKLGNVTDPTVIYYRDGKRRAILEQQVTEWCEAYRASHDNMKIYYEGEVLRVYQITHTPPI